VNYHFPLVVAFEDLSNIETRALLLTKFLLHDGFGIMSPGQQVQKQKPHRKSGDLAFQPEWLNMLPLGGISLFDQSLNPANYPSRPPVAALPKSTWERVELAIGQRSPWSQSLGTRVP
jgi:hypothetical protein